jgi:hypothetical protein
VPVFSTEANPATVSVETQTRASQPALAVDARGRLHAVWSGGTRGTIMYSWVFGRDAATQAWAEAEPIPGVSEIASWPALVADPRGDVLHLAYAVPYNEKRGVYYVRSRAQGEAATASWLTPTVVFDAVAAGWDSLGKVGLALDAAADTLHAVWLHSDLPGGSSPQAVYYARSTNGGATWSTAQKIIDGMVDWPRLVVAGKQAHLLWNKTRSDGSAEVWEQYSTDGGAHWSKAALVRGFDRVSGPVAASADGAGVIFLSAAAQGSNGESVLLTTRWDGAAWGKLESFGLGQNANVGNGAVSVLSAKGDRLGVLLRHSTAGQDGGSQFAIAALGRAIQAAVITPAATFTPLPTATRLATRTPQATATPVLMFPTPDSKTNVAGDAVSTRLPSILGGVMGIVLVLGVLAARALLVRRRR